MTSLHEIPGIDPDAVPLLQRVGVEMPSDLVAIPAKTLRWAMEGVQGGEEGLPTEAAIVRWQEAVRAAVVAGEGRGYQAGRPMAVAQPLSGWELLAAGIPAAAVPVARVLGGPGGSEEVSEKEPRKAKKRPSRGIAERERGEETLPPERPKRRVAREVAYEEEHDVERDLESMVFTSTEERSRAARDFVRKSHGMTHKNPWRVLGSAVATLLAELLALVGVGVIMAAILLEYVYKRPVPSHLALGLLAFPLALLVFLVWGRAARCRLCGARLFVPRQCLKHVRAHRSILGYVTTLALQVVFFRWFCCSLCGTRQKLKQK